MVAISVLFALWDEVLKSSEPAIAKNYSYHGSAPLNKCVDLNSSYAIFCCLVPNHIIHSSYRLSMQWLMTQSLKSTTRKIHESLD